MRCRGIQCLIKPFVLLHALCDGLQNYTFHSDNLSPHVSFFPLNLPLLLCSCFSFPVPLGSALLIFQGRECAFVCEEQSEFMAPYSLHLWIISNWIFPIAQRWLFAQRHCSRCLYFLFIRCILAYIRSWGKDFCLISLLPNETHREAVAKGTLYKSCLGSVILLTWVHGSIH